MLCGEFLVVVVVFCFGIFGGNIYFVCSFVLENTWGVNSYKKQRFFFLWFQRRTTTNSAFKTEKNT